MPPHLPPLDAYLGLADGRAVPVYRQLVADSLTPVSAYARLMGDGPSFLFESVVGGERVGRYSFLGSGPFLRFRAHGRRVETWRPGEPPTVAEVDDPLDELKKLVESRRSVDLPGLPRFVAGAVGVAAYDSARYAEDLPNPPEDDRGLPDLDFGFYDRMVIFDHIRKTTLVVALALPGDDPRAAYEDACSRVDELVARLSAPAAELTPVDIDTAGPPSLAYTSNLTRERFEAIVARCPDYIRAGDIFQVVPSQRLVVETTASTFDIYRSLRVVNPSPFLFHLTFDDYALIGSSPEILVRVEAGEVTIRPLAGTRRRGRDDAEDRALAAELLADPKERAEHVMLVDLGRNDVGRVAVPSSVKLTDLMTVERYSHVMHITSNVTGTLAPGKSAFDALRAGLPAGTVSGAPKLRAMQVIDEVEPTRRGPYGGAVGYFDFTGNMDTCIALRTIVVQDKIAYIQAGAGIVYDSVPSEEYDETINKARGLLKAIEVAENFGNPPK